MASSSLTHRHVPTFYCKPVARSLAIILQASLEYPYKLPCKPLACADATLLFLLYAKICWKVFIFQSWGDCLFKGSSSQKYNTNSIKLLFSH